MKIEQYENIKFYNRLKTINNYYYHTPESKRFYKLNEKIRELSLKIKCLETPCVFEHVVDITNYVLEKMGSQNYRGKVRDGIIAVCIYYACKKMSKIINYNELSNTLNLPVKYITSAETIILELLNNNIIHLDKQIFLSNKTPIDYLMENINNIPIKISDNLIQTVINIINICENNNILFGNTPFVVSIGCLYYTILNYSSSFDVNIKQFVNLYKISESTLRKIYKIFFKLIIKISITIHN